MQMCMSWRHLNFIRRYFYDSAPNEGVCPAGALVAFAPSSHAPIAF